MLIVFNIAGSVPCTLKRPCELAQPSIGGLSSLSKASTAWNPGDLALKTELDGRKFMGGAHSSQFLRESS